MKVCYFGKYNPNYSRNAILLKGLRENGIKIIECRSELSGWRKYWDLIKKHWRIRHNYDVMIVGFAGNHSTILAKFLTRKPIIFDAFSSSFYDSMIFDRLVSSPYSLKAKYYWLLDWLPCKLADYIFLDTDTHIDYFVKTFKIKREKFYRIWIGALDSIFYPRPEQKNERFIVHFHASFIPLQGTKYIIEAANILRKEDIIFQIVGHGLEFSLIKKMVDDLNLARTVKLLGRVPVEEVPNYIAQGDICLGIFGDTPKTQRVIPNKIYESLAMEKPIITADTPAVREIFQDGRELVFCQVANGSSLAAKILELKNNPALRQKLAQVGYNLYQSRFCPRALGQEVINIINK